MVAARKQHRSVTLVARPLIRALNSFTKSVPTTDAVRETKPRLLIEIVSKTPCWLFRERAECEACGRPCVLRVWVQLVL